MRRMQLAPAPEKRQFDAHVEDRVRRCRQSSPALEKRQFGAHAEDRVRKYRQSSNTHADHEDALTNFRSMKSAINDGFSK